MKTLLMMIALAGLTMSSNAQSCSKRVVHHRTRATHHRVARVTKPLEQPVLINNDVTTRPEAPCVVYKKHNITVTQCPGVFYDNSNIDVQGEGTYMGNYPQTPAPAVNLDNSVNGPIAPQHNVIEEDRGRVAPADGNTCVGCKSH